MVPKFDVVGAAPGQLAFELGGDHEGAMWTGPL